MSMLLDARRGGPSAEQWEAWGHEFRIETDHFLEAVANVINLRDVPDCAARLIDVVELILFYEPDVTLKEVAKGLEATIYEHCHSFAKALRRHEKDVANNDPIHRLMSRKKKRQQPRRLSDAVSMQHSHDREKRWLAFRKSLVHSRPSEKLDVALASLAASREAATKEPDCARALGDAFLQNLVATWTCYRRRIYAPFV